MKRKNLCNFFKAIGVACFATGFVSTWEVFPVSAADYTFSGEITPNHDLTAVYFLFAVGGSGGEGTFSQQIASFMAANTTTAFNLSFNSLPDNLGGIQGFTVLALYDPLNGGVAMGYDPALTNFVNLRSRSAPWEGTSVPVYGAPGGQAYQDIGRTEADVATALQLGASTGICPIGEPFSGGASTDPTAPSDFALLDFSGASIGGTGTVVQVVPEPGFFSLLAAGASVLSFGWLGRRTWRWRD